MWESIVYLVVVQEKINIIIIIIIITIIYPSSFLAAILRYFWKFDT